MKDSATTRRRFLIAAIAFSGVTAGAIGPGALRFASAWAQSGGEHTFDTLVRLARLMLPHDGLTDDVYAEVLNEVLAATADDASVIESMLNGHQAASFMAIDEEAQLTVMGAIEHENSFATVLGALKTKMYEHPKVWEVINYEGPSYQEGGYLNRGAGDIDWLPEGE